jgi:hypothetical protein
MFTTKSIGKRIYRSTFLAALLAMGGGASRVSAQGNPPAVSAPEAPPRFVAAPGKGLTVTSADNRFAMTVRSRVQLREAYLHAADGKNTNDVNVKTLRLFVQGHVLVPELKYTIQLAFGSGDFDKDSSSPIFDAFVDYTLLRDLNVRVGQYFVPFDRARTIREFALQFVDRQQVVRELTLDRDLGIMLSSSDLFGLGSRLAYNAFLGAGDGKNRVTNSANPNGSQVPSLLAVGRVIVRPFGAFDDDQEGDLTRKQNLRLALGAALGYSVSASRQRVTTGDYYTQGTFDYLHAAADLVVKYAGFSLLAEGVLRDANRRFRTGVNSDGKVVQDSSVSGYGYFVQAGQMLTDKLEVTARWDDLYAKDKAEKFADTDKGAAATFARLVAATGRQVGGGLNLYLNGHALKLQTDYFYGFGEEFKGGSHGARLQLDATF